MKNKNRIWIYTLNAMIIFLMFLSFSSKSITQESSVTVKDIDGNVYNTVVIGTQVWMKENLKTTKYNDGSLIPNLTNNRDWSDDTIGAYCWYNNDEASYKNPYGALYNCYAVETGKLCPKGWHLPSNAEWALLTDYLGGGSIAGIKLKETGYSHWIRAKNEATNESGFTALPGGQRKWDGYFLSLGEYGCWWSIGENRNNTELYMKNDGDFAYSMGMALNDNFGFSVRCVKD